jgi:hypothetical protein
MAEISQITFSGMRLRVTHDNGSYSVASLPNSGQPTDSDTVNECGSPFSLDAASTGSAPPVERLAAKVGEALNAGGVGNGEMLGFRLADKFVREHPEVIAE